MHHRSKIVIAFHHKDINKLEQVTKKSKQPQKAYLGTIGERSE